MRLIGVYAKGEGFNRTTFDKASKKKLSFLLGCWLDIARKPAQVVLKSKVHGKQVPQLLGHCKCSSNPSWCKIFLHQDV